MFGSLTVLTGPLIHPTGLKYVVYSLHLHFFSLTLPLKLPSRQQQQGH